MNPTEVKVVSKKELRLLCGGDRAISERTFTRWIQKQESKLLPFGYQRTDKLIKGQALKVILYELAITID